MRVAAVDIGTNSMRLLITDGMVDLVREERVTGLGRGVDLTGRLADDAVERTLVALAEFRGLIDAAGAERVRAIATSASRDAVNRDSFFDAVERTLGVRPDLVSGEEEARLGYAGAAGAWRGRGPVMVIDIGGGSTEFVTADNAVSVGIGSVRLTERVMPNRPAPSTEITAGREMVGQMFSGLDLPACETVLGIGGTWTEIPRLGGAPDDSVVDLSMLDVLATRLAQMTVEETVALGVPPMRASVLLAGIVIAGGALKAAGCAVATVSIRDSLDGVAAGLLSEGLA
ncbi:MAG TPA: exopolyphosphatase [Acidimicrobiia bacterium]